MGGAAKVQSFIESAMTDFTEQLHYENPYDNKKLYFPFESSGLRYEIKAFLDSIGMKDIKPAITKQEILKIIQLVNKYIR